MSGPNEVWPEPPMSKDDRELASLFGPVPGCLTSRGAIDIAYIAPLEAFLAKQYSQPRFQAVLYGDERMREFPGTMVWLVPRSEIGEVTMELHDGTFARGESYCVHVVHVRDAIELVLQPTGSWIT